MPKLILTDETIDELFMHPKFSANLHKILIELENTTVTKFQETMNSNSLKSIHPLQQSNYLQQNQVSFNSNFSQLQSNFQNIHFVEFEKDSNQPMKLDLDIFDELYSQISNLLYAKMEWLVDEKIKRYLLEWQSEFKTEIKNKASNKKSSQSGYNPEILQTGLKYGQQKNGDWDLKISEKIQLGMHRHSLRIESIFADKLNTSEMKINERILQLQSRLAQSKGEQKMVQEVDLSKKLKASRSIGRFLGLK